MRAAVLLALLFLGAPGHVIAKTKIKAFIESKCPTCYWWMIEQLEPVVKDAELSRELEVELYPFGNAIYSGSEVQCQHGAAECEGNAALACANKYTTGLNFSLCLFKQMRTVDDEHVVAGLVEVCAPQQATKILQCLQSTEGKLLVALAAKETVAVNNRYTPWITVDGAHSTEAEQNLRELVCKQSALQGKSKSCQIDGRVELMRKHSFKESSCSNPWSASERAAAVNRALAAQSSAEVLGTGDVRPHFHGDV
eukprot:TRINITY_DN37147_c0_g1_i1.p1 TRINITY_DN37147_c0_g1~~TRINITY_DN37147_c0_g1_i1.p1  ORF type:complete len:253 (-),score=53.02 TRINITY_DN37147_c0_g1_i1:235-993(-)